MTRWLLRCYPRWWRSRYGAELADILTASEQPDGKGQWADLLRGAVDAWLHPPRRSHVAAVAALTGGAMWTALAIALAQEPPTDWPGYSLETVPLAAVGVAALVVASGAAWLRLGDRTTGADRLIVAIAVLSYAVWFAGLAVIAAGGGAGFVVALAAAGAAVATGSLGAVLVLRGDWAVGGVLCLAPAAVLVTAIGGWIWFGLAWTAVGLLVWPRDDAPRLTLA